MSEEIKVDISKHTPTPWRVRFFGFEGKDNGDNEFFIEADNNNKSELGYGIEILQEDFGDHNGYPREQRLADAYLIVDLVNKYKIRNHVTKVYSDLSRDANATSLMLLRKNQLLVKALEEIAYHGSNYNEIDEENATVSTSHMIATKAIEENKKDTV